MRSKSTIYIAIVFALILVVSVGYALFSENIKISGTAKAEGDFNIDLTCQPGLPNNILAKMNEAGVSSTGEKGYINDTCSVTNKTATFGVAFNYPGAKRYFTFKMTNTGTMDAYHNLDTGIVPNKYDICFDGIKDNTPNGTIDQATECYDMTDENMDSISSQILGAAGLIDNLSFAIETTNHTILMDSAFDARVDEDRNVRLEPGESLYYVFIFGVNENLDITPLYITTNLSFDLNFTQMPNQE